MSIVGFKITMFLFYSVNGVFKGSFNKLIPPYGRINLNAI